jgi:hypothetical protein
VSIIGHLFVAGHLNSEGDTMENDVENEDLLPYIEPKDSDHFDFYQFDGYSPNKKFTLGEYEGSTPQPEDNDLYLDERKLSLRR